MLERVLHWGVGLSAITALATGYIVSDTGWNGIGLVSRTALLEVHKSLALLIVPVCMLWAVAGLHGAFGRRSAGERAIWCVHAVLVTGFFAIAMLGWAASSAGRYGQDIFGIIPFPEIVPWRDPNLSVWLYHYHKIAAYWVMLLLGVHICGALVHLVFLRDGRVSAMLWGGSKGERR